MPITALYAGLLTPILVFLAVRVIRQRRVARVAIGHGDDALLLRRMRVHANFAEHVPLALVLIGLAESLKVMPLILHLMGLALLVARILHAYGVSQPRENFRFRVIGTSTTFSVLLIGAVICVLASLGLVPRL